MGSNFSFLKKHDQMLVQLGSLAERYFVDDPNTCLLKLRQFGEELSQHVAACVGLYMSPEENQFTLLNLLWSSSTFPSKEMDTADRFKAT